MTKRDLEDAVQNENMKFSKIHKNIKNGIDDIIFLKNILSEILYMNPRDMETAHVLADEALLAYINDDGVKNIFYEIPKWYA